MVSGKRFAYKIVQGLPDEIAICRELLKRPLNRHLREAILRVIQGKAELEDLPAARGIEVDADTRLETSV